jgi:hypothetical protein
MTERFLYVTPDALKNLATNQMDAVELASLDTFHTIRHAEFTEELAHYMRTNGRDTVLCTPADCAALLSSGSSGTTLPRKTVLLNFADARSEPLRSSISSSFIHFILGVSTTSIMRALLGSILEYNVGRGYRGIMPRLSNAKGLKTESRKLHSSSERSVIQEFTMDSIRKTLKENSSNSDGLTPTPENPWPWPGSQFFHKAAIDILDELLMNAIWDANPSFHHLGRGEVCTLENGKSVSIDCTSDGITFGLSVEDHEGTFPWKAIAGPLTYALGLKPELKVNEGPGGAGLGLFMILQRTSILTVEVQRNRSTRVTVVIRFDDTVRDMQARPKTVLVFSDAEAAKEQPQVTAV